MVPLSESIGITSNSDHGLANTSNGSPSNLSFAKVQCYLLVIMNNCFIIIELFLQLIMNFY